MTEKKNEIWQIDAFTTKAFGGNPAGVTFADNLQDKEKQLIAREMNLAETAFLSKSPNADFKLQWFTPKVEVQLCGHATIASIHFLHQQNLIKNSSVSFETRSGILKCGVRNGKYFMQIPVFTPEEFTGNQQEILTALGLSSNDIDEKYPFIILENSYLYIYVKKLDTLKSLNPDFKELENLTSGGKGFDCVTVFTLETFEKEDFAHLRFFAPYYGINEDPVTGSANGPLMIVLLKLGMIPDPGEEVTLTFEQGDIINRRGRVQVSYNKKTNELYIMGNAVSVFKGEMSFSSEDN